MILRIKVWPAAELAKTCFVIDAKVVEFRRVEIDLRTFDGVSQLTEYGRSLLWEDFFKSDPHAWERVGEIVSGNIQCWEDDKTVLNEWVSHLFRESISDLNREWTQAVNPETLQAQAHQAEIDKLALDWDPSVVRLADDPRF